MKYLSICSISFVFLIFMSVNFFMMCLYFIMNELVYFLQWEVLSLNTMSASLVIFCSKEYMSSDENINRFTMLVVMFMLSMMLLIISSNLISILMVWDGLGLVSNCLVIYFQNIESYNAEMLTALSNRICDVALLLTMAWMLNYGWWNYMFYLVAMQNNLK